MPTNKDDDKELKKKEEPVVAEEGLDEDGPVAVEEGEGGKITPARKDDAAPKRNEKEAEEDAEDDEGEKKEADGKTPEEREAIRKRRREERQARKDYQKQREREIEFLRRQNSELSNRIGAVENRNFGSDLARIDAAIVDAEAHVHHAKGLITKAAADQNGAALAEAQDALYSARRRHEDLTALKGSIGSAQRKPTALDPRVANNGKEWMTKNSWFDPRGRDADSRVALAIDNTLVEEGWKPEDPGYWEELSTRINRYMPHRRGAAAGGEPQDGQRQQQQRQTTMGSDREGSSAPRGAYVLSGDRVKAMKEAGMWDQFQSDPAFKARMLKRFKDQDATQGK